MKQCHKTISFLLIFFSSVSASGRDTITPTQPLADNETLISVNGTFALGFFIPPNSNNRYIGLWYNLISEPTILWVANRANPLINSSGTLSITTDGRLLITDLKSTVVWWSTVNTASGLLTSAIARLLDNGNLVVVNQDRDPDGESDVTDYAWQGFDHLTDTLLPGMQLGVDLTRGVNRTLVSWKSYNDPSPGEYYVYMDNQADAEMYLSTATTKLWRSGPWDGTHLSGIQYLGTDVGLISIFVNNLEQVTFAYNTSNRSVVSRLTVNTTGLLQHSIWLTEEREWNLYWFAPQQMCDVIGSCGPYGVCSPNNSPMCGCLQGFTPKNPKNWSLRNGTDGCVRKTSLDCTDGTDRFLTVSNVKLPQSETVDMSLSLHECRDVCLSECSCTAYAVVMTNSSGSGRGCAIWVSDLYDIVQFVGSGQDLYMRMATDRVIGKDVPTDMVIGKHTITTTVMIIVIVVTGVLILTCAGFFLWRRQKRKIGLLTSTFFSDGSTYDHEGTRGDDMDLPIFTFDTIASATDNFSVNNKLGKGGFGPVYKGQLTKGQEIAVKRLAKTSAQGHEEFKNEVMLIAKLQHRNLVRLLGCCIQREERVLIYEYMPNGSLDAFLFEEKGALLDWNTRYLIIMGIARGLLYLHHDSRLRIIHRDLKASNILLDKHMNPKISDFGMARIFGGDELDFNTRKVVGTYGYMSPEYAMEGIFSVKSDVFSFGVLVLEIISGRKNRGEYTFSPHLNLVAHAWNLWNEGRSLQLVHESMSDSFSATEALKCIKLGLLCVQERPEDRPLISSVVVMLTSDITSLSPPKQPGFVAYTGPHGTNPSSNRQESCRSNELTVSLDGR